MSKFSMVRHKYHGSMIVGQCRDVYPIRAELSYMFLSSAEFIYFFYCQRLVVSTSTTLATATLDSAQKPPGQMFAN